MKKIRVNLKRGTKSWSFMLYDSAESAYYLKDEPVMNDEVEEYRRVITLSRGEVIEAEWLGAEWVYDEDIGKDVKGHKKFDRIRLGKISPLKNAAPGAKYLELYSGWVNDEDFVWISDKERPNIRITQIKNKAISKLDFSKLFSRHSDELEEGADDDSFFKEECQITN